MKILNIDFKDVKHFDVKTYNYPNCWISPTGDYYGFPGAKHVIAATYIGIVILGKTDDNLKKGQFFNQTWDGYLLKNGWLEIKNITWLTGGEDGGTVMFLKEKTQKQRDVIFALSEIFPIKNITDDNHF